MQAVTSILSSSKPRVVGRFIYHFFCRYPCAFSLCFSHPAFQCFVDRAIALLTFSHRLRSPLHFRLINGRQIVLFKTCIPLGDCYRKTAMASTSLSYFFFLPSMLLSLGLGDRLIVLHRAKGPNNSVVRDSDIFLICSISTFLLRDRYR